MEGKGTFSLWEKILLVILLYSVFCLAAVGALTSRGGKEMEKALHRPFWCQKMKKVPLEKAMRS